MKVKTSELTGAALDWAVAQAEEGERLAEGWHPHTWERNGKRELRAVPYAPSSDWSQGGPIIRDNPYIAPQYDSRFDSWFSCNQTPVDHGKQTYLQAAMRCYVASKLGDEVDVPKELT